MERRIVFWITLCFYCIERRSSPFFIPFGTSFALCSLEKCSSTEPDSESEDFGIMRRELLAILLLFLSGWMAGDAGAFDVEEYQLFLERNEDLGVGEL